MIRRHGWRSEAMCGEAAPGTHRRIFPAPKTETPGELWKQMAQTDHQSTSAVPTFAFPNAGLRWYGSATGVVINTPMKHTIHLEAPFCWCICCGGA
ncbi:uncharacterized protein CC84DRAFT_962652 [Paraphaeosphaeria sporulosa]|uniref:Uncharacterized protein n=1 Tax=Paraphaeosphaeria sporulosa TaxID=1460663 RepID=A0A177C6E1_9PLEO|nr:uncharacterized protein CC84DRAFT_962652 [Paraphaeosphaeria sporulosa]OAG03203.1 hypothetical protein CC84DRAFT_962652 [Paraphaeosphaeria sporulosa]